jgi:hypothetical protein
MYEIQHTPKRPVNAKQLLVHKQGSAFAHETLSRLEAQQVIHSRCEALDKKMIDAIGQYGIISALNIYENAGQDLQPNLRYNQIMPFNFGGTWRYCTSAETPLGSFSSTILTEATPNQRDPYLGWYQYFGQGTDYDPRSVIVEGEGKNGVGLRYSTVRDMGDKQIKARGNMTITKTSKINGETLIEDIECKPSEATEFCIQVFDQIEQTLHLAIKRLREPRNGYKSLKIK